MIYDFGANPPPTFMAINDQINGLATSAKSGVDWGVQVGTAILGLMLIAAVIKVLIDKV